MVGYRQARWDEKLIQEYPDRGPATYAAPLEPELERLLEENPLPRELARERPGNIPRLSETEIIRHYTRLSHMSYGVDQGPVPLGSCTMKYNPRLPLELAFSPEITRLHPLVPTESVQGVLEMLYELQGWLEAITGMDRCVLHPAAGAHGELAGVLAIRKFHLLAGDTGRIEIIVPDSAHGTNPSSASMAGFRVLEVPTGPDGNVDMDALRAAVGPKTAGLMITNPSTLGLFEENIVEIAKLVHGAGGLLYYDGANLNGIMGYTRPGDMGFDIAHLNVHKTFSSPHGGGGPGAGPVCARAVPIPGSGLTLADLLPGYRVEKRDGLYTLVEQSPEGVRQIRAFPFNTIPLIWAYIYILSMGPQGLRKATETAVAKTNYFLSLMKDVEGYTLPYASERPRKHEAVLSAKPLAEKYGVRAEDVAKGLLDRGFYAPTIYFPLIVEEALMIEFTETEPLEEIESYAEALKEIARIARENPGEAKEWPRNTSVRRVDQVYANHPRTMAPTLRVLYRRGRAKG